MRKYTAPKDDISAGSVIHWGEHFFFTASNLEVDAVESAKITIEVRNHRLMLKDSLVGCYELDLTYIYFQPNHSLIHKWIALCNPESANFQSIRGHIKLGITVQAEGDPDFDLTCREADEGKDAEILLPPQISLKPYQLVISLLRAEGLPQLDDFGTIDAYCEASFGGARVKSSIVKADKVRYSASWYEELYLPVMLPNVSSKLVISMMDDDPLRNEAAGCLVFEFKKIEHGEFSNYFWRNLYGAPAGCDNAHAKTMNNVPEAASAWHGRILLKIELREVAKAVLKTEKIADKNIADLVRNNFEAQEEYELRCQLYSGVALPPKFEQYSVLVTWASASQESKTAPASDKKCTWNENMKKKIMKVPVGYDKLSDIFITLVSKKKSLCYARLNPLEFTDVMTEPKWISLTPDKAISEVTNEWEGGYIRLRLYIGRYSESVDDKKGKWHIPPGAPKKIKKARLLFNLFQCRDLPAADSDGQSDPYVEVYCNGTTVSSRVIDNTLNPMWYTVIPITIEIVSPADFPPIVVYVKDKDISSDDLIGVCTYLASEAEIDAPKPAYPAWKELGLGKIHGGQILASLNLYLDEDTAPSYSIEPKCMEVTAEINCLGLRDLTPAVGWLPVNKAFVKFDMNSLQLPSEKLVVRNVQTQPGENGPNPTINAVIKFNFSMPVDNLFAPAVTCIVYDYLFKGLSQPQIGVFNIRLGDIYHKLESTPRKPIESKGITSEEVLINIEKDSDVTEPAVKVMKRPTIEEARKGMFVVYPEIEVDPVGRPKEKYKPDNSYMPLGHDRTPQDKILHYRYLLAGPLEDSEYIDTSAFESFPIKKGQERGEDSWVSSIFSKGPEEVVSENTSKITGYFKGIVRVTKVSRLLRKETRVQAIKEKRHGDDEVEDNEDEDFADIRRLLLQKTQVVVRVYIVSCQNLAQKDLKSHSDPFIKIKLAGTTINDSKNAQTDQPNPRILKHFDILSTLPGASRLKIQVWDKDDLVKDDKIGETVIDLEDRYFSNKWRRITEKPIERRVLTHRSTKLSQGSILLWVEIHPPNSLPPPLDISDKPPTDFEARLIVWQTEGVQSYDTEGTSDLYVRALVNDSKPKETDTHYRCQNGKGQFNWRMTFPLKLPSEQCLISLQIWDRDVFSSSDFIADTSFAFKELARDAFIKDKRLKMRGGKDELLSTMKKEDSDRFWVECSRRKEDGSNEASGKVEISFELVPKESALACPVGEGRDEPNIDPHLPEPTGRFQWSLNPCSLINQTCGPGFRCKICCVVCCILSIYLVVMITPSIIGSLIGKAG